MHPRSEAKRRARDRWVLLALLLLALCIGVGIGAGVSRHLEFERAASAPLVDCRGQRADVMANVDAAPILREPAPSAPTRPPDAARASESAASARSLEPPRPSSPQRRFQRQIRVKTAVETRDAGAPAHTPGPDLHEALRLLRAAQRSLRTADASGALSLLAEMVRRTPDVLVEEREVTRVLAHCAANDIDSARRTAAALRESGAALVYAHRLSKSCVGPAPAPASLVDAMRRRALN